MGNTSRRSSRQIRGLAPQVDVPPPTTVYLPTELKAAVLAQLDKRDLKTVRLLSKEWNALATGPLFDRVYISCRAKDMEVFKNVTRHPVISTGIRELVYDGSLFARDMDIKEYFWHLYGELPWITKGLGSELFNCANDEINGFVEDFDNEAIKNNPNRHENFCSRRENFCSRHFHDEFIVEGHKNYQNFAEAERLALGNGLFLWRLWDGVGRLNNLRSVVLSSCLWTYCLHEDECTGSVRPSTLHGPESGSPLVRSWNPFHLRPFSWDHEELEDECRLICKHFHTVTSAISQTRPKIKSFEIPIHSGLGGGLPPQALIQPTMTNDHFTRTLHAYSGLEVLNISINAGKDGGSDDPGALASLPRMLQQMTGLKSLNLKLSKFMYRNPNRTDTSDYYTYQQVFPRLALWPKLTELSITGLAIGGWDLTFLLGERAKVKDLTLRCIELIDGTWEGVFAGLCHSRITELSLSGNFKHQGGQIFQPDEIRSHVSDSAALEEIVDYVTYGGRHPCLAPDADPESDFWWYLDMMPDEEFEALVDHPSGSAGRHQNVHVEETCEC